VLLLYPDQWRGQALAHLGDRNALTPRVDTLAAGGVRFDHAVSPDPVCTPARSSMLTGVMPWSNGMCLNGDRLPDGTPTIATALRSAGYRCGWIGKWHLEGEGDGWVPTDRRFGFVDAWAAHNFTHNYLAPVLYFDEPVPVRPPLGTWGPDWETELAMEAIEQAAQQPEPFFLTVSWGPPHPNGASPNDWRLGVPPEVLASVDPDAIALRPNVPLDKVPPSDADPYGIRAFLQGYYACISALDASVGRLLDHLEALGLADDTLVLFTSDHGEMGGSHGLYKKSIWFDEAVRVPLIARWPNGFGGGRRYSVGASLLDLAPTLTSLCTGSVPEGLHGRDLSPWLRGEASDAGTAVGFGRRSEGPLAWRGVRTPTHKLVELASGEATLLFDLVGDPYESRNAVDDAEHAEVVEELHEELVAFRARTADPLL
jgi:arylsulfatase A-like enzyme